MSKTDELSELLIHQAKLQAKADAIVDALGLDSLLADIGSPTRVGSSALGLMVHRDIDITVICKKLKEETHRAVVELGGKLAMHASIGSVRFRNDTGIWNRAVEEYPDGLYLGVTYRDESDQDWTFDIWFVDEPERQPDLKHLRTIPPMLTTSARQSILALKTALANGSFAAGRPSSFKIYEAVLEHGVTSLSEFGDWLNDMHRSES
ncbi:hypothetical protein ACOXPD_004538 [Escherichia coli O5:H32]|uniref:hypothetical protein n=1 Tax=Enterobacteriaceae TaxID=543 RepID=UPI000E2B10A7|nr:MULTISPECIES: hypothetical protein [Enterobacteriaceae]EEX2877858.1 hypothetical protein [Escherichia coli]EGT0669237.1 hypothetical protein [Citrobacter werkmanii]HDT6511732.1 hypothetical protein [Klebsiella aerogenes]EFB3355270.1 hypothetical protein [Escherichia coli]EFO3380554.1 hypothetical protein [Escherichia coli]